jgi:hypothetical protein
MTHRTCRCAPHKDAPDERYLRPTFPAYALPPRPTEPEPPAAAPASRRRRDPALWSTLLTAASVTGLLIATGLLILS